MLYFEGYYPNQTEVKAMLIKHHAGQLVFENLSEYRADDQKEHCLNILLQAVQCNPDLTVFPMQ